MNRCPITYEECGDAKYSEKGLRLLSRNLTRLKDLPYSASEQIREASLRAGKMSIQGVQPKLSAVFSPKNKGFEIVDTRGKYILKPQLSEYFQVPENEDLTMRLAASIGIDIPLHGLVYSKDGSLTYFIKRFDRVGRKKGSRRGFCTIVWCGPGHQIPLFHGKGRPGHRPVLHVPSS